MQQTHRGTIPILSAGVGLSSAAETCPTAPPWARQAAKDFYHGTALICTKGLVQPSERLPTAPAHPLPRKVSPSIRGAETLKGKE